MYLVTEPPMLEATHSYRPESPGPRSLITRVCLLSAITALAPVTDMQQVIVGTNTGTMGLWDFRTGQGYRGLVRKFGGSVGAVRDIATQPGAENQS